MQTFYYTFGSNPIFPYQNGWVEIKAPDRQMADNVFMHFYPQTNKNNPCLNCAFVYKEEEFKNTIMAKKNTNLGFGCHKTFTLTCTNRPFEQEYKLTISTEKTKCILTHHDIKNAYEAGILYLQQNENDDLVCYINEPPIGFNGWFYFDSEDIHDITVERYKNKYNKNEIVNKIHAALNGLTIVSPYEYDYYACIILKQ